MTWEKISPGQKFPQLIHRGAELLLHAPAAYEGTLVLHPGSKPVLKHQCEFSNLYCLHEKALTSILSNCTNLAITFISQNMSAMYLNILSK